ncbi:nucleotidyltransferase domain-containing protein [Candidatus Uhrbacteria bacterium]|nr:nucleotidyltransferase domain-containing protein [Candidatus Uhrbacteria bacterium]
MVELHHMEKLKNIPTKEIDRIAAQYHLALIFAFGSYVKGHARPDSDFDIAVLPTKSLSNKDELDLISDLTRVFKKNVDLTVLTHTSPLLKMQLVRASKLLYGDPRTAAQFRTRAVSEYLDTAHLRALTRKYLRAV